MRASVTTTSGRGGAGLFENRLNHQVNTPMWRTPSVVHPDARLHHERAFRPPRINRGLDDLRGWWALVSLCACMPVPDPTAASTLAWSR